MGDVAVVRAAKGGSVGEVAGVRVEGEGSNLVDGADQNCRQVTVHLVIGHVDGEDLAAVIAPVPEPDLVRVRVEGDFR